MSDVDKMELSLPYRVHGVSFSEVMAMATFQGSEIQVKVPTLDIELTHEPDAGQVSSGSIVLHLVGKQIEGATPFLRADAVVELVLRGPALPQPDTAEQPQEAEPAPTPTE